MNTQTQNQVTRIENPFGIQNQVVHSNPTALVTAESQRAIAEVQAALAIAKSFPRDRRTAVDRILNDCMRNGLAEVAVYQYSRGGAPINGPTIRLAESLAQNWGNIQYGVRELSQANGESTVEAFAWDVETNTRQTKIFQVPHIRYSKAGGAVKLTDPRDIYELIANNGSRRLRACILGVIPGDIVETALQQCEETLKAHADCSSEGIQKLLRAFELCGVSKEAIEKRIQCRIEAIKPAQIVSLKKVGSSIKEGMSTASDWFDMTLSPKTEVAAEELSTFENLKRQILTVKTFEDLEAIEEQALDHEKSDERKQLVKMIYAQREKLTPNISAERPTPEEIQDVVEPAPAEEKVKKPTSAELKKTYAKSLNNAKDAREVSAIESQIIMNTDLNEKDLNYLKANIEQLHAKFEQIEADELEALVTQFKEQIQEAKTPEALTQIRMTYSANGTLSDQQHQDLNEAFNQKMASFNTPKADPMKSLGLHKEISQEISQVKGLQDLNPIAQKINATKAQLTTGHFNELKQMYAERKTFLENQINMFDESFFEMAMEKIKTVKMQEEINDLMICPEFYELNTEEKKMLTDAASKRSGQIQSEEI